MEPRQPALTAYTEEEPWRLNRLARVDGRVREIMRVLTREPAGGISSLGEVVWAHGVTRLHDDRGTLVAHVTAQLVVSPWLGVVTAVIARAWDGEDEREVVLHLPDGRVRSVEEVLPALTSDA